MSSVGGRQEEAGECTIERVQHVGILNLPNAGLERIPVALRFQLGGQDGLRGAEAYPVRVGRPIRHALAIHLLPAAAQSALASIALLHVPEIIWIVPDPELLF